MRNEGCRPPGGNRNQEKDYWKPSAIGIKNAALNN